MRVGNPNNPPTSLLLLSSSSTDFLCDVEFVVLFSFRNELFKKYQNGNFMNVKSIDKQENWKRK